MNGGHDLGGVMGFGPVRPEHDEPVFHHHWEGRVRGLVMTMSAAMGTNIDQGRFAREAMSPAAYLNKSYYEIWFDGLMSMLDERGLVVRAELVAGRAIGPVKPVARVLSAADAEAGLRLSKPYARPATAAARFSTGQRVRTKNMHPAGHTRLPRYVRGHVGTVEIVHGVHVFPDTNAAGDGENPQWLYSVRFAATELWGDTADPAVSVATDAWESYLEPVT